MIAIKKKRTQEPTDEEASIFKNQLVNSRLDGEGGNRAGKP